MKRVLKPNRDWNQKLDTDMICHQMIREHETEKMMFNRMEKDANCQREKRSKLIIEEEN